MARVIPWLRPGTCAVVHMSLRATAQTRRPVLIVVAMSTLCKTHTRCVNTSGINTCLNLRYLGHLFSDPCAFAGVIVWLAARWCCLVVAFGFASGTALVTTLLLPLFRRSRLLVGMSCARSEGATNAGGAVWRPGRAKQWLAAKPTLGTNLPPLPPPPLSSRAAARAAARAAVRVVRARVGRCVTPRVCCTRPSLRLCCVPVGCGVECIKNWAEFS